MFELKSTETSSLGWHRQSRATAKVIQKLIRIATAVGLYLPGLPFVLPLAILVFFLDFIPYVGLIILAVPAMLDASSFSLEKMAYVALLYFCLQQVESYLLSPFIQRRAISIPPSVILVSQLIFGTVFGILGILLATPMTEVIEFIKATYAERVLDRNLSARA